MLKQKILDQFKRKTRLYGRMTNEVARVVEDSLSAADLKIHSVSWRIKSNDSLADKLAQPDRTYSGLDDITDLVGVRIITYLEDCIDRVAELIEQRFRVDLAQSIDKRKRDDPTSFGYNSLHYVCRLKPAPGISRTLLNIPFEIQIRTILQHAWAEIEHDLGYKSQEAVPAKIRRKFSRVAGLLEIADEEFVAVRKSLQLYESQVQEIIAASPERFEIDVLSLKALLKQPLSIRLDKAIARILNRPLETEYFYPEYLVKVLRNAGLDNMEELGRKLQEREETILAFMEPYLEFTRIVFSFGVQDMESISRGYSLLVLAHLELLESSVLDLDRIVSLSRFYQAVDDAPPDFAEKIALALVETYRSFQGE